jgi:DNA-binding transcriptional ArsR family regulator
MNSTNAIFKAISHPARREILTLLAASDHSVKELTAAFKMSQPAISQHLRELRGAKLVTSQKIGAEQQYRLTAEPLKAVSDWCLQYRRFFDAAGHAWAFASSRADPQKAVKKAGR